MKLNGKKLIENNVLYRNHFKINRERKHKKYQISNLKIRNRNCDD